MTSQISEADFARVNGGDCTFRADDAQASKDFRAEYATRSRLISPEQMPMERSADGLIKHLMHERFNSAEMCVDAYMQFIDSGSSSGRHRHIWEEIIFVADGEGHDLHWDMSYECDEEYHWAWDAEPKKFAWKRGDFIFIPPYTDHQHFATGPGEARLIVISNRIIKKMGMDWFDQVSNAPGFEDVRTP